MVPGDLAGQEVVPEAVKALQATGCDFEYEWFEVGAEPLLRGESAMSDDVYAQLGAADAILFGAIGDPRVPDVGYAALVLLKLRFELDLYVNLRPAKLYDARLSPLRDPRLQACDMVIVRENTEGLYVGSGGRFKAGTADEVALQEDVNTYKGVSRILTYGLQVAREKVCMVDKSNAMHISGALWQERWRELKQGYPDLATRHLYVDAAAMELVRDPTQFEVIVTNNMFGDILSDLAASLVGGMGVAPSANLNPETGRGLFEPVHGSAPNIAGRGIVNPVGSILSSALMARHLGNEAAASAIEAAVEASIKARECTPDLGGSFSTSEVGDAIARRL